MDQRINLVIHVSTPVLLDVSPVTGPHSVPDNLIHWMLARCLASTLSQITDPLPLDVAEMPGHPSVPDNLIHRMLPRCLDIPTSDNQIHGMLPRSLKKPTSQTTWSMGCCPDICTSPHHRQPDPQDAIQVSEHSHITGNLIHTMLSRHLHITDNLIHGMLPR